jgi:ferredoxin
LCAKACHEGAIGLKIGKAKLLRDDYCDGLGNCLPVCPTGAISFEEREAAEYDEAAVKKNLVKSQGEEPPCACPGTISKTLHRESGPEPGSEAVSANKSRLSQWPVQIKLVPVHAPYFQDANLLVAADCAGYAFGDFHESFMKNRVTLIGCPKLDEGDYAEKLTAIIRENSIRSVTVARMEVPCCGGIESAVKRALQNSGKFIPWQVVTIAADGRIL